MKDYHPCGVIRDSQDQSIAYLLRAMSSDSFKMEKKPSSPALCVTADKFAQYVKEDKVQLFQDKGNGPEVSYTEEECKKLGKAAPKTGTLTGEQYWNSEVIFNDATYGVADGIMISVVCMRKMQLVGATLVQGAIYVPGMPEDFAQQIKSNSCFMGRLTTDLFLCNWERSQLINLIISATSPVSVCTRTMRHSDNAIYAKKMMGFTTPPDTEIIQVADELDALASYQMWPSGIVVANGNSGSANGIHKMTLG